MLIYIIIIIIISVSVSEDHADSALGMSSVSGLLASSVVAVETYARVAVLLAVCADMLGSLSCCHVALSDTFLCRQLASPRISDCYTFYYCKSPVASVLGQHFPAIRCNVTCL